MALYADVNPPSTTEQLNIEYSWKPISFFYIKLCRSTCNDIRNKKNMSPRSYILQIMLWHQSLKS